jgi:hypothetical protein
LDGDFAQNTHDGQDGKIFSNKQKSNDPVPAWDDAHMPL